MDDFFEATAVATTRERSFETGLPDLELADGVGEFDRLVGVGIGGGGSSRVRGTKSLVLVGIKEVRLD